MTVTNKQWIFTQEPEGLPVEGKDMVLKSQELDLDNVPLHGGVLTRVITVSLDPTLRNSMRWQPKPYSKLYEKGQAMWGYGVTEIIRSEKEGWQPGQLVYSRLTEFGQYQIVPADLLTDQMSGFKKLERLQDLNITSYVGAAGMPGMTAYMSLKEIIGDFKPNSSMFVTSAAGAVGQLVCQLAKAGGVKVIASAGSDDKVEFLTKHCKVDRAFNYKTSDASEELSKFGGEAGIDYFFDNVGGPQLEAYITNAAVYGTIIVCGAITAYNSTAENQPHLIKNFPMGVLSRQLTVRGFIVSTFIPKWYDTFIDEMPKLLKTRTLKAKEDVRYGIDSVASSFIDLLTGNSNGKVVVLIDTERKDKWITAPVDTFSA
ncbi:unnamed protein product [Sympodiomycopsis kandeliae]